MYHTAEHVERLIDSTLRAWIDQLVAAAQDSGSGNTSTRHDPSDEELYRRMCVEPATLAHEELFVALFHACKLWASEPGLPAEHRAHRRLFFDAFIALAHVANALHYEDLETAARVLGAAVPALLPVVASGRRPATLTLLAERDDLDPIGQGADQVVLETLRAVELLR